jgi:hypothetical protein
VVEVPAAPVLQPRSVTRAGLAVASVGCGLAGLLATGLAWLLSFTSVLDAVPVRAGLGVVTMVLVLLAPPVAVVLGALGLRSSRRPLAVAGLVLGAAALVGIVAALALAG